MFLVIFLLLKVIVHACVTWKVVVQGKREMNGHHNVYYMQNNRQAKNDFFRSPYSSKKL